MSLDRKVSTPGLLPMKVLFLQKMTGRLVTPPRSRTPDPWGVVYEFWTEVRTSRGFTSTPVVDLGGLHTVVVIWLSST